MFMRFIERHYINLALGGLVLPLLPILFVLIAQVFLHSMNYPAIGSLSYVFAPYFGNLRLALFLLAFIGLGSKIIKHLEGNITSDRLDK